jgi:hypothetical protein
VQLRDALYGPTNVIGPDSHSLMPCYYFRQSAFFRWQSLDCSIVSTLGRTELCINSYSTRAASLRTSSMQPVFGTTVRDPSKREVEASHTLPIDVEKMCRQCFLAGGDHAASQQGGPLL